MKLTIFLFLLSAMSVLAGKSYSQTKGLTLDLKNSTVKEVLQNIENQSEFYFMYSEKLVDVKREVSVSVRNKKINEVLDGLFAGTDVNYKVKDRFILLTTPEVSGNELVDQQQVTVSGKVTDSSRQPLPGVTVAVKGKAQGTITDANGNYSLSNVQPDAVLVFSFVGMRTQEVPVAGKTNINVTLVEETIGIDEVVAIGYGTVKKADLTGSVASVGGSALAKKGSMKVSTALQGAMSGVTVTRTGDAPGSDATIRIRGITTIGDSNPLVIVDGVPGSLSSINPDDIESISVLKDAASASIYGSKAAAGVILVTTKRAKKGELNLTYNGELGYESPTKLVKFVDAVQYMKMNNELVWNDAGNVGTEYPKYSQDLIQNYNALHAENPDQYPDTDYSKYLKDYAPRQTHNLTITAGQNNVSTVVSMNYDKIQGFFDNRDYQKMNLRMNNDITVSKKLHASIDLNYFRDLNSLPAGSDLSISLLSRSPIMTAFYSDGRVANFVGGDNVVAELLRGGTNTVSNNQFDGKIAIDFSPIEDLKFTGVYAPHFGFYKGKNYSVILPMTDVNDPSLITGYVNRHLTTKDTEARNDYKNFTTQFLVTYIKNVGKHSLNFLAGYENYYSFSENLGASRDQYSLTDFPYLDLGPLTYRDNSGNAVEYASRSYFGRIMYNYKDRYLFQTNARYDGSSRFDKNYRWGLFPSMSVGWVISEESFMKAIPVLSYLKLRVSWGALGNERIGNYPYQATVAFGNS